MRSVCALLVFLLLSGPARADAIEADENVQFFPGYARYRSGTLELLVRGWIFEPETDSARRRALLATLREALEIPEKPAAREIFQKRAAYFLVDNERGKRLTIRLAGEPFTLEASDPAGHFGGVIPLTGALIQRVRREARRGLCAFSAGTVGRPFAGQVQLIGERGLSVISDIDDTIKVSNVLDKKELIASTFEREFRAVDGMARLYRRLERRGAVFHYVSGSPWQLYPGLGEFRARAGFPFGSFHLRPFRLKDSTFFEFVKADQLPYKRGVIQEILRDFPLRQFIFIGDSGEKDPEVYASLARENPGRVRAILIRDVHPPAAAALQRARYTALFTDLPGRPFVKVFRDASEIRNGLVQ